MQDCGIEINEDELLEMQQDDEDEMLIQQHRGEQFGGEEIEDEAKNTWDIIVAFGGAVGKDG